MSPPKRLCRLLKPEINMNHNYHLKLTAALGLLVLGASTGRATNVTTSCMPGALTTYINGVNSDCVQGSQSNIFNYGFTFETRSNDDLSDVPGNIQVTPNNPAGTLSFSGFLNLPSGSEESIQYFIGYNIDPPPILTGDSISLDPFNDAVLTLYVCQGSVNGTSVTGTPYFLGDIGGNFLCGSTPNFSGGTTTNILDSPLTTTVSEICSQCGDPSGNVNFPATNQVGLLLELSLVAPPEDVPGGSGNGTFSDQSTVPEPASALMFGSGLAVAFGLRRLMHARLGTR
jgi:hypothetical protein